MANTSSRQARRALRELRQEAKKVQRSSDVMTARKIEGHADVLEKELERLEKDREQFLAQITSGRAAEQEYMAEIVELRKALELYEEEQDDEPQPLPPDYWETAQ